MSQRVINAGIWMLLLRVATRAAGFVRNVVLARLLSPQDFGLFGITLVVLSILDSFTNTGLQSALIQKREQVSEYLDTAWTVQALRGVLLALTLILGAPYIATFFEEADATALIQMLGLAVFLSGIQNPGILHFQRELKLKPQFLQRFGGTLVDLTTSVILAFVLQSAWALMWGMIAGRFARLILSYLLHPYRPHLQLDGSRTRELGRYGRWVFLNNVLFFLAYRGDNFIIGKFLGAPALGIYVMAYSFAEVATAEVGRVTTEIGFPVYSRLQGELKRLRTGFLTATTMVSTIAFPTTITICLVAEPITRILLGARWSGVAALLPPLAIAGSVRAVAANGIATFNALGRPSLSFRVNLLRVGVTYLCMIPLIARWELVGVAIAVAVGQASMLPLFLVYVRRALGISMDQYARSLLSALILGGAVGALLGSTRVLLSLSERTELILGLLLALTGYCLVSIVLWRIASTGPIDVLARLWLRNRQSNSAAPGSFPVSI